jgi:hypothetical protein
MELLCSAKPTGYSNTHPMTKRSNASNSVKKMQKNTCKLQRYGLNICQTRGSQVHGLDHAFSRHFTTACRSVDLSAGLAPLQGTIWQPPRGFRHCQPLDIVYGLQQRKGTCRPLFLALRPFLLKAHWAIFGASTRSVR